jgi:predicted RNase H-like HicB family nuclease
MKIEYSVQIVWSPEDNAYLAFPTELPGCIADGPTREDALANLKVVIDEWIEAAKEEGREIPQPMSVLDLAQKQRESRQNFQKYIESEVRKTVDKVLQQLIQSQPQQPSWEYRGGMVFEPSEEPFVPFGGER